MTLYRRCYSSILPISKPRKERSKRIECSVCSGTVIIYFSYTLMHINARIVGKSVLEIIKSFSHDTGNKI